MDFKSIIEPLGFEDFEGAFQWAEKRLPSDIEGVFDPGALPDSVEQAISLFETAYGGTARADLDRWVTLNALAGTVEGAGRLSAEFATDGVRVFSMGLGEWLIGGDEVWITLDWAHIVGWTVERALDVGRGFATDVVQNLRQAADAIEAATESP